jgi:hypothetical protein
MHFTLMKFIYYRNEYSGSIQDERFYLQAERLPGYQEGFCSVELANGDVPN